jgi:hypothetical protein
VLENAFERSKNTLGRLRTLKGRLGTQKEWCSKEWGREGHGHEKKSYLHCIENLSLSQLKIDEKNLFPNYKSYF